jgi:hypothetical protein
MWSSWVKEKGKTQVMYIAKLKDGLKRVKKTFWMILERVFEMLWWRGRNWNHIKNNFWRWSVFLISKIDFPFYLNRLLELSFLSLSLSFDTLSLDDLGFLLIFEEKITSSKTAFQMDSIYWQWTHIPKWSYAHQHG